LGTAFAITKNHVVTACHNLVGDDGITFLDANRYGTFQIDTRAMKQGEISIFPSALNLKVIRSDTSADWAILEVLDSSRMFPSYLPICPVESLPQPHINEREELKSYHAPIGYYSRNAILELEIWSDPYQRVLQYDQHHTLILVAGGLYRGSCGAPYVNHDGLVVAMHLSSSHEGKEFSSTRPLKRAKNMKDLVDEINKRYVDQDDTTTDMNDVHNSNRQGFVLANSSSFMDALHNLHV